MYGVFILGCLGNVDDIGDGIGLVIGVIYFYDFGGN